MFQLQVMFDVLLHESHLIFFIREVSQYENTYFVVVMHNEYIIYLKITRHSPKQVF